MGESPEFGMYVPSSKTRIISVSLCGWHQNGRKESEYGSHVEQMMKNVDIDETTAFLDHVYWRCTQRERKPNETIIEQYKKMFESRVSAGSNKIIGMGKPHAQTVAWSYDMEGHAQKMRRAIL